VNPKFGSFLIIFIISLAFTFNTSFQIVPVNLAAVSILSFNALQHQSSTGLDYWHYLNSLGIHYLESALDQLFPPVRGGGRIHRHFTYRSNFDVTVPNWSSDLLWQTEHIQDLIYRHQHPSDCSRAKFIIAGGDGMFGLGSYLHQIACIWVKALETGRIFIYHPNLSRYPRLIGNFCRENPNGNCLFEPVTNCTIYDNSDFVSGGYNSGTYPRW
jgi:hypothetical protein